MPILKQEPDLFPEDLFAVQHALKEDAGWWAMYTLARREKDLVRRLRTMNIAHYCPMVRKRFRSPSGRVRESFMPLFSGYVFVHGDETDRYQALTSNCVSRCLPVPDSTQLVRELGQIYRLIQTCTFVNPESRLLPGQFVRVKSGPMMGMEGTVIKQHGKERFMVALNFLQQGASVLLEDFQLELI